MKRLFLYSYLVVIFAFAYSLRTAASQLPSTPPARQPANASDLNSATPLTAGYEPVKMLLQPNDRIVVRGFKGNVFYHATPNRNDLTVRVHEIHAQQNDDDWQLSVHRNGNAVMVDVDGPTSKKLWNDVLANPIASIPTYDLVIEGPSRPLEISWQNGRVQIANLDSDVTITNMDGETDVAGDQGNVTVSSERGTIRLQNLNGDVKVDTYDSQVFANSLKGELTLENFIGASELASISGDVAVTTYRGPTHLSGVKGSLAFASDNGPFHIEKFQGVLRGQSDQGSVFAEIEGKADVRMQSQQGDVHLQLPQSGAWVNLGTNNGQIWVPSFLKTTRLPAELLRTGRLHGLNRGSIYVRTTSGNIRIQ